MDKSQIKPLIDPILNLLKSRKFLLTVFGLLVNFLIIKVPELAPYREELIFSATGLIIALVSTIAYEDGKLNEGTVIVEDNTNAKSVI